MKLSLGVLLGILVGGVPPGSPNLDSISDYTCFQTWPPKSVPVFRPGGGHKTQQQKTEIMLSLLRIKPQQKDFLISISNSYITLFSYSFGNETTNILIRNRSSFVKPYPLQDQNGQNQDVPVFRPNRRKNPTLRGGTYLYGLYIREYPPPPPRGNFKDSTP